MTLTVTHRFNTSESKNDFATVSSWLSRLYNDSNFKKITPAHLENVKTFLQQKWHPEFSYTLSNLLHPLTHSTFSHEWGSSDFPSNEKLEFIGDSVLNLLIAKKLFEKFPEYNEGKLSKLRGALVNEDELYRLGLMLDLSNSLFLGKGELKKHKELPKSMIADAFEAILGNIFLQEGLAVADQFLEKCFALFESRYQQNFFDEKRLYAFDSKSILQERLVKMVQKTPEYKSLEITPGLFRVELWVGDELVAVRSGNLKKQIEKDLAKDYLLKLDEQIIENRN